MDHQTSPRPASVPLGRRANPRLEPRVEVLTAYSHTTQLADLQRCGSGRPATAAPGDLTAAKRAWSLRDRLDEHTRADLIAAYRTGATGASLAGAHGLSLRSVKRLVAAAGGRRHQLSA
jgi:hypothetical protein